jgi:hypothetical protein
MRGSDDLQKPTFFRWDALGIEKGIGVPFHPQSTDSGHFLQGDFPSLTIRSHLTLATYPPLAPGMCVVCVVHVCVVGLCLVSLLSCLILQFPSRRSRRRRCCT